MATIFPGRFTAKFDEPFVVFIIGMRVNRLLQFSKWIPVAKAMPPMIAELKKHPEMGLLHVEQMIYWRGVATVQYWRSFDHLHAYAHMREGESSAGMGGVQSAGWRQRVGGHLARELPGRRAETTSASTRTCRDSALGRAAEHVPVTGRLESARQRIGKAE